MTTSIAPHGNVAEGERDEGAARLAGETSLWTPAHLRWFTLRDARELLAQAGLEPVALERRPRLIWRTSRLDDLLGPVAVRVPGLRTLVTFQHVLAAYPARPCP
jgi:hypothetical protein